MLIGTDFRHTFGSQAAPDPGAAAAPAAAPEIMRTGDGTTRRGAEAPLLLRQIRAAAAWWPRREAWRPPPAASLRAWYRARPSSRAQEPRGSWMVRRCWCLLAPR